jgi:hypothetical protein
VSQISLMVDGWTKKQNDVQMVRRCKMKPRRLWGWALLLIAAFLLQPLSLVGITGAVHGATLVSPAISINAGTQTSCRVVNVSPTPRTITIQLFRGFAGLDVTEFSDCADEVLPGTTCAALYRNQTGGGEDVYCKITVNGGKNSVRGVLSIEGTCNATCETSVAVEAR